MQTRKLTIPDIIDTQYKQYSLYVLEERSLPSVIDGLKPVHRRSLWSAYKSFKNDKVKVSKLTGSVMGIHPHGDMAISNAISNMAQGFCGTNNVPYFNGHGALGSKIMGSGNGIGASRYVSVSLSENFTKIMGIDISLLNMVSSYDDSEKEPTNFLPLVPAVLLNPLQGIAVGFACNILPRKLSDVIHCQLQHLDGKGFREPSVYYDGFRGLIEKIDDTTWKTTGVYKKIGKKINITELPVGYTRESFVKILDALEEKEIVSNYVDDCTDDFNFTITLKVDLSDVEINEKFKMSNTLNENITVIGFNGKVRKMTFTDIIKEFTDYRFGIYLKRYKKLFFENRDDYEFKKDLYTVIHKELFKKFPELTKQKIKEYLIENSIQEKHIDKIIQIPIYRFGKDEIEKLKSELLALKTYLESLVKLCKDEGLRKVEYIKELKEIKVT